MVIGNTSTYKFKAIKPISKQKLFFKKYRDGLMGGNLILVLKSFFATTFSFEQVQLDADTNILLKISVAPSPDIYKNTDFDEKGSACLLLYLCNKQTFSW